VWVMSDDEDASKSNLVCNGQTQQWQAVNVAFTSEGIKFDGTSSKMTLENVNFFNLTLGLTILLRIRRESRNQPFIDMYNCDTHKSGMHIWETITNRNFIFKTENQLNPALSVFSKNHPLPTDPTEFSNIGVAGRPPTLSGLSNFSLFHQTSFLAESNLSFMSTPTQPQPQFCCFCLGCRLENGKSLVGIIRSVGISDTVLTADEINGFFEQVN
jgi:hypothetical protein